MKEKSDRNFYKGKKDAELLLQKDCKNGRAFYEQDDYDWDEYDGEEERDKMGDGFK